jgi:hypothetical protein
MASRRWSTWLVLGALLLARKAGAGEPAREGTPPPPREATYRVWHPAGCEPCALDEQLKKQDAPNARDCGTLLLSERGPGVLDCVRESLKARAPFRVRHQLEDKELVREEALVSDGRRAWWLTFDESELGMPGCAARVVRRGCGSLVQDGTGTSWPRCEKPGPGEVLCDQLRHVEPDAPQPVSRLTCTAAWRKGAWLCDVHPPGTVPGPRTPRREGPDLLCEASRSGRLYCRAWKQP